jgi:hypothetical protein
MSADGPKASTGDVCSDVNDWVMNGHLADKAIRSLVTLRVIRDYQRFGHLWGTTDIDPHQRRMARHPFDPEATSPRQQLVHCERPNRIPAKIHQGECTPPP